MLIVEESLILGQEVHLIRCVSRLHIVKWVALDLTTVGHGLVADALGTMGRWGLALLLGQD